MPRRAAASSRVAEHDGPYHICFRRPGEMEANAGGPGRVFLTFFSPRQPIPAKIAPNHYRFPLQAGGVYRSIVATLALVQEDLAGHEVFVHFGWPLSSWLDRTAMGIFVAKILRLPKQFPEAHFVIEHRSVRTAETAH